MSAMNSDATSDIISREILGQPVMVTIGGREHPLTYPVHNIFLYRQLSGDSLFRFDNWKKIDFEENYDAWLACLWAGLHAQQPADSEHAEPWWKAPYTRSELEMLIGFANAPALHNSMVAALTAWMPEEKRPQKKSEEAVLPIESLPIEILPIEEKKATKDSEASGHELAVASD